MRKARETKNAPAQEFVPVPGSRYSVTDARTIGPALLELAQRVEGQQVEVEDVVMAASDPGSPLHPYFVWDDVEAARLQRLDRAAYLVRNIKVRWIDPVTGDVLQEVPVLFSSQKRFFASGGDEPAPSSQERVYVPIQVIMGNEAAKAGLVEDAFREIQKWRRKWEQYQEVMGELGTVRDAIRDVEARRLVEADAAPVSVGA